MAGNDDKLAQLGADFAAAAAALEAEGDAWRDETVDRMRALEREIAATPAAGVRGLNVKARVMASVLDLDRRGRALDGAEKQIPRSLVADIARLAGAAAAVRP